MFDTCKTEQPTSKNQMLLALIMTSKFVLTDVVTLPARRNNSVYTHSCIIIINLLTLTFTLKIPFLLRSVRNFSLAGSFQQGISQQQRERERERARENI